ncbi:hypothetical protein [Clostridium tetani]|uniref:Uncharacterized protein n=1 Tax=Clostridium tetani TaxID=1513 RepID=A0ABY0ERV9_CLOTA|nr:hypothetical protein [Clostridium tetani]RXI58091.1 hypothetical protein DP131_03065 [Clostridium tetani]RXI66008.1 hypothetical protein DQN76_13960 [Clostridium tetani]
MDARKLTTNIIKEGIARGNYEITGILETGEITVAILSDVEIEILNTITKDKQIKNFMNMKGRPAKELLQVYKQKYSDDKNRCIKNNLRLK